MNIVVIDDEQASLDIVSSYCEKLDSVRSITCFQDPLLALNFINQNQVDLVVSDINMPALNGLELKKVMPSSVAVIFMTAHASFALDAFELNAVDYLLKPVSFVRFVQALDKVSAKALGKTDEHLPYIFVKIDGLKKRIDIADIKYIQANGDYVNIVTSEQEAPFMSLISLSKIQKLLPTDSFLRVHRSTIVNLAFVDIIDTDHLYIGEQDLIIGKTYRKIVEEKVSLQSGTSSIA